MPAYDAIIVGTGGVGSAALYHLSRRGLRVLGLDRFPAAHDRGSSHGHTRLIRQAYFEHPAYVPLLFRAYELWDELERATERKLFERTGLLQVGPSEGVIVPGVLRSAAEHQLDVSVLDSAEAQRRWPGFRFPDDHQAVFEEQAGFLYVEDCVAAHLTQAIAAGAEHRTGVSVLDWSADEDSVLVRTDQGEFSAARLILTAGSWAPALLRSYGLPLQVVRKHLHWFADPDDSYLLSQECPCFFFETAEGGYYGTPTCDDRGVKAAEHFSGPDELVSDPLQVNRQIEPAELRRVQSFLRDYLPAAEPLSPQAHSVCMYTKTPSEHFIVDRLPETPQVAIACGLSGHGFKFTCVLGEILADLVLDGQTVHPIDFLTLPGPQNRNSD